MSIRAMVRLLAAALAFHAAGAEAQTSAARPIRFVVPFGPGGGIDVLARTLTQKMSERGRPAIVDNRPGASGIVAVELVMDIRPIVCRPGQIQAPDCGAPAGRPGFGVGLILLPFETTVANK